MYAHTHTHTHTHTHIHGLCVRQKESCCGCSLCIQASLQWWTGCTHSHSLSLSHRLWMCVATLLKHTYVYTYIYMSIHIYNYVYAHTHTHTHTHTYTHTCTGCEEDVLMHRLHPQWLSFSDTHSQDMCVAASWTYIRIHKHQYICVCTHTHTHSHTHTYTPAHARTRTRTQSQRLMLLCLDGSLLCTQKAQMCLAALLQQCRIQGKCINGKFKMFPLSPIVRLNTSNTVFTLPESLKLWL